MLRLKRNLCVGCIYSALLWASICWADTYDNDINNEDIQFFLKIQHAVVSKDKQWLAGNAFYPLNVYTHSDLKHSKLKVIHNKNEFIRNYAIIINKKVELAVKNQDPQRLFKNWQGVMIGNGEIWFGPLGPVNERDELDLERYKYYIFSINN